ncbi:glycosyltransferase [Frigidibacter sp.]|uniref:glycosyltransferase n=1 Tax=Frigidibacter sp. TaxID=2586418 RepID=UPI0027364CC8|nr:glycosyltransferase [Frigidibacter sp.]MDP3341442.1 glycosyltransferase [Frigidibacter sp.]
MRILLVHQNFPAQFLRLAPALRARGHEVLALTGEGNQRPSPVRVVQYPWDMAAEARVKGPTATYQKAVARGMATARVAAALRGRHGYVPDVILGHSGWGETLYLREVWPEARQLAYAEFMYGTRGLDTDFDPEFRQDTLEARMTTLTRRAHMTQALVDCDAAVAPTRWQASTFPPGLRDKISVIHDGLDTARVCPDPAARLEIPEAGLVLRPGDEVLSYVSRSLEPYRGIHVFLRALPEVLAARPKARVVIIGDEGQSYGTRPPCGTSWKQRLLAEVDGRLDLSRVHFLGRVPYPRFLALLQVTRVHAYLTYPFVLSWSLIEAMAAGAVIVASRTPPVEEVLVDGTTARLVEFFDVSGWSAALTSALAEPGGHAHLGRAARAEAVAGYDLERICLPQLLRFVEAGGSTA